MEKLNKRQLKKAQEWWDGLEYDEKDMLIQALIKGDHRVWSFKPTEQQLTKMYLWDNGKGR